MLQEEVGLLSCAWQGGQGLLVVAVAPRSSGAVCVARLMLVCKLTSIRKLLVAVAFYGRQVCVCVWACWWSCPVLRFLAYSVMHGT